MTTALGVQSDKWGTCSKKKGRSSKSICTASSETTGPPRNGCTAPAPGAPSPAKRSRAAATFGAAAPTHSQQDTRRSLQHPARRQPVHLPSMLEKSASSRHSCGTTSCCRQPSGRPHRLRHRKNRNSSQPRSRARQMPPGAQQASRSPATLPSCSDQCRQQSKQHGQHQRQSRLPCQSQRPSLLGQGRLPPSKRSHLSQSRRHQPASHGQPVSGPMHSQRSSRRRTDGMPTTRGRCRRNRGRRTANPSYRRTTNQSCRNPGASTRPTALQQLQRQSSIRSGGQHQPQRRSDSSRAAPPQRGRIRPLPGSTALTLRQHLGQAPNRRPWTPSDSAPLNKLQGKSV